MGIGGIETSMRKNGARQQLDIRPRKSSTDGQMEGRNPLRPFRATALTPTVV